MQTDLIPVKCIIRSFDHISSIWIIAFQFTPSWVIFFFHDLRRGSSNLSEVEIIFFSVKTWGNRWRSSVAEKGRLIYMYYLLIWCHPNCKEIYRMTSKCLVLDSTNYHCFHSFLQFYKMCYLEKRIKLPLLHYELNMWYTVQLPV